MNRRRAPRPVPDARSWGPLRLLVCSSLRLLIGRLRVQRVEVHRRQQELREAALRYEVRHGSPCIREQHARTNAADSALDVVFGQVLHQEDTGLFDLDEENRHVVLLGSDRHGEDNLTQLRRQSICTRVQVEVDLWIPVAIHARAVRCLVGTILQIHVLQGEGWAVVALRVGIRHTAGHVTAHNHAPELSKGSRPPSASRAYKSSHPPTCLSPMKICGTERRPLRAIISARASGRSSISIVSYVTPLRSSNPRARAQYGHQSVKYITTFGCPMTFAAASHLLQRQVLSAPCADSATEIERLGESLGGELPHGGGSQRAGIVINDDYLFFQLLQRIAGLQNLIARHLLGAGDMTARECLGRPQVNDGGATLVHQPHEVLRGHGGLILVPAAQLVDNDQYSRNGQATGVPRVMRDVFEEMVHSCRS